MFILYVIGISVLAGFSFFFLGRLIGNAIGKKQKMQDEVLRNGSKHV